MYHWLTFVCGRAINNIALVLTPRQFCFWTKLMSFLQRCSFAAMVNFTKGNYRPCIDIEWVLSSLICLLTLVLVSIGTVNKLHPLTIHSIFKQLASPFSKRCCKTLVPQSYILGKHQQVTNIFQNTAFQKQVTKGQFIIHKNQVNMEVLMKHQDQTIKYHCLQLVYVAQLKSLELYLLQVPSATQVMYYQFLLNDCYEISAF